MPRGVLLDHEAIQSLRDRRDPRTEPVRITVVMATCDGSPFLQPQLDSIADQTRPADELLVADDCSTDATPGIVRRFLAEVEASGGARVGFRANASRLGSTRNFEQLIRWATGDVIVFADQDDVWRPTKLETLEKVFRGFPGAGAVFTDARIIDGRSRFLGSSLWEKLGFTGPFRSEWRSGNAAAVLVRRNVVTGATLAFRSSFREHVLPIPGMAVHDFWIALVLSQLADLVAVAEPTIDYRLHDRNQVGLAARSPFRTQEEALAERRRDLDQLASIRSALLARNLGGSSVFALLEDKAHHLTFRLNLPRNPVGRAVRVARHHRHGGYRRFALGARSALVDIVRGP